LYAPTPNRTSAVITAETTMLGQPAKT
jgi:hypothetical protein